jgi:hypothetical protein
MFEQILKFIGEHPIAGTILTMIFMGLFSNIISRAIRLVIVLVRGWPPPHLDADGDWKPAEESE